MLVLLIIQVVHCCTNESVDGVINWLLNKPKIYQSELEVRLQSWQI